MSVLMSRYSTEVTLRSGREPAPEKDMDSYSYREMDVSSFSFWGGVDHTLPPTNLPDEAKELADFCTFRI